MAITVQLPTAKANTAGAMTQSVEYALVPVTVADTAGNAATTNITILPFGSETIDGLSSVTITTNYGYFTLLPNLVNGGWTTL